MLVIITVYITMHVVLIPVDVAPVSTEVGPVPLQILAVLVDIRLAAGNVALLVLARALLGVFLPQAAFIGTQVRAIPLDILAVRLDVRPVMRAVAPITRHIVAVVVAGRLLRRLLIVGSGRWAVVRVGSRQCRTQYRPDSDGNEVVALHDTSFVVSN